MRAEIEPGNGDKARMQSEISYRRHPVFIQYRNHVGYIFGDTYPGHMVVQQGSHIELHYQNDLIEFDLNRSRIRAKVHKTPFA